MNMTRSSTRMRLITIALSATIATAGLGLTAIPSFAEEGEDIDVTVDEVVDEINGVLDDMIGDAEPVVDDDNDTNVYTGSGPALEEGGSDEDVDVNTEAGPAEPEEETGISVTSLTVGDPLADQLVGNTVATSYGINVDVTIDTKAADELYDMIDEQRGDADPLIRDATLELCAYQRAAESSVLFADIRPDGAFFTSVGADGRITSEILIAFDAEIEDSNASDAYWALGIDELALLNDATNIGIAEIEDADGNIYWTILLANDNADSEDGTIQSGDAHYRLYVATDAVDIEADEQTGLDIDADDEQSIVIPVTISGEMQYGDETAEFTDTTATFENTSLVWNSSNPDVAEVDENGVVTGVASGTCTVSATYNGNQLEFLFDVAVTGEEPDEATLIDLADCMIAGIAGDYVATGDPVEPAFTVIYQSNTTIDPNQYQAEYTDNTEPGTATLTVTANDDSDEITGSITKTFEIVAAEPDPNEVEPGPVEEEPEPDSTEPEPTTEEPEPDSTEPEPTTEEPEPESTEPEPTTEEPEPEATEPEPDSTEPEPETTEPDSTEPEPATEEPEPETTEPEPAAEEPEPESTEPEPTTEEPEPEATEPEPEATEPEPTSEEPEAAEPTSDGDTTVTSDTYDPDNVVADDGTDATVISNPTVINEPINIGSEGYTIATIPVQTYTGSAVQPTITLNGPYGLTLGTDYILSYSNNVQVGTASVTVEGIGSYTGTLSTTFQIVGDISQAAVTGLDGQTYTGSELTPAPVVTFDQTVLTSGTDYDLTYENNINAGLATVTITGKGSYTGTLMTSFTISPKSIADAQISPIASTTYTGMAITPTFTVTDGTTVLSSGTDYTVAYEQNIDAGAAHIVVTGVGNYTGTIDTTFVIAPIPMSSTTIVMPNMAYTGLVLNPTPISVTVDDLYLVDGIDYEIIDYSNNIDIGNAKITLQGIGNFTGTVTADWKIVAASDEDPGTTNTLPQTGDSTNIVAIVAGSIVGAAIIVVAIILIVRYVRNRNRA